MDNKGNKKDTFEDCRFCGRQEQPTNEEPWKKFPQLGQRGARGIGGFLFLIWDSDKETNSDVKRKARDEWQRV